MGNSNEVKRASKKNLIKLTKKVNKMTMKDLSELKEFEIGEIREFAKGIHLEDDDEWHCYSDGLDVNVYEDEEKTETCRIIFRARWFRHYG